MNISSDLEQYLGEYSTEEPLLLGQLRRETYLKSIQPHMLSGVLQGRLLSMLSKIINPENILEIGTFTGYSALCLAEGLAENGKLITIDKNGELEHISQKYLKESPAIDYINGDAIEIIPSLEHTFDLVFLDADKENYATYIDLIIPKLSKGGIVLADNVLWKEKVLDAEIQDKQTVGIREFNQKIIENSQLEVVILPVRDGISIIRKK